MSASNPSNPATVHEHSQAAPGESGVTARVMRRVIIAVLLTVVLVPPAAGFYSYFSGVPLHLLAKKQQDEPAITTAAAEHISLVAGEHHAINVPDEVCTSLGIRKGSEFSVAVTAKPTSMRPLELPGSTAFDPSRLARIRARFAPARVVELPQVHDFSPKTGHTEFRELRQGDPVQKGGLLGVFYSVDVGSKKNDLLDALVQLELDQEIFDDVERHRNDIPKVFYLTQRKAVQSDRNAVTRALNNLRVWDIPAVEIDALHAEAHKIASTKDGWAKTPEGRWVKGEKTEAHGEPDSGVEHQNPWGRVTLRAPFEGVVVEKNVHIDEMVVDNTVNLFQIADVSRLLVIASVPEDRLPELEGLGNSDRRWTIHTAGVAGTAGLPGTIDEIGYIIDPNQHTAVLKGYVDNPGKRLRAGQYVTATVHIPPPDDVVEVPTDALIDDGRQAVVFVQPDAVLPKFVLRRVEVVQRFERTVFVRSTALPEEQRLTPLEKVEGLLSKEPLHAGERVLLAGALELKAAMLDLEEAEAAVKANAEPGK